MKKKGEDMKEEEKDRKDEPREGERTEKRRVKNQVKMHDGEGGEKKKNRSRYWKERRINLRKVGEEEEHMKRRRQ